MSRKLMRLGAMAAALLTCVVAPAAAQDAAQELARGDSAYAALDAAAALDHYARAAALDTTSYQAAWKASRSAADLEVRVRSDDGRRAALQRQAESLARRAVSLRPDDAEGQFSLVRALGVTARSAGIRQRVRYAVEIRERSLRCLQYDPEHAGCLHVLGAWNAEVMRLSGFERFFARRVLGARTLGSASWADAVRYLEAAVAAEPLRVVHRAELGDVYRDVGRAADARQQYEEAIRLPVSDYNDPVYKEQARSGVRTLAATTER